MGNNKQRIDAYTILCVGVGGTGGLFSSTLARYIYSLKFNNEKKFNVVLVDADRVAEHNVNRQPFTSEDVGEFKVDVLAEAFTELYDISVNAVPMYIDKAEDVCKIFEDNPACSYNSSLYDVYEHHIIIGGVDNHRCRQVLNEYFEKAECSTTQDLLYIDSANEFDFGTCVCGFRDTEGVHCPPRAFFFPNILKDKGKSASEISCGEINVSAPQHLLTNSMAANIIFSKVCNFITNHKVEFGVTSFFPFKCEVVHRGLSAYGISDFLSKWKEFQERGSL